MVFQSAQTTVDFCVQNLMKCLQQLGLGLFEEACSKLVQQTQNVLSCSQESLCLLNPYAALQLHMQQRMLQSTRQTRQSCESHSGGAASQ